MSQTKWDTDAAVLRDDGYGESEIERVLGPRPGLQATRIAWQRGRGERAARTLRGLVSTDQELRGQRLRVAPAAGPKMSWQGKRERLAEKMAAMRGLHWDSLSHEARDGLLALAEFVLQALQSVEEDARRAKTRPMR